MATAEEAVRNYLTALRAPELLRDEDRISELSKTLQESDDPIERLRLRSELTRVSSVNIDDVEAAFVKHAKRWASEHDVPASVFKQEGVSREVLGKAGLTGGRQRQPARRSRVSREAVGAAIPPRRKFTIVEVADKSGASPATVRSVVTDLLGRGELEDLGPAEGHSGRGRAPTVYKRAGK